MFKLDLSPYYPWPVAVSLPGADGKPVTATFTAHFARKTQKDVDDFFATRKANDLTALYEADKKIAETVLIGWGSDLLSGTGEPLPFSEENRAALLNVGGVRRAVVDAWLDSLSGSPKKDSAATGN